MCAQALAQMHAAGLVAVGDTVIVTAGVPFGRSGSTNLLRVEPVDPWDLT